jgi:Ni/Co efflux regulator RcnB
MENYKMKQTIVMALSLMIAVGPAVAQPRPPVQQHRPAPVVKRVPPPPAMHRPGQRLAPGYHAVRVDDYRRHGLPAPKRGHRWVRVGGQYLLIGIASGLIASAIVAR